MKEAPTHPSARIEWSEWQWSACWKRGRSEGGFEEGSRSARLERIVEGVQGTWVAKERLEQFERVSESEDIARVERLTSGVTLGVSGWLFGRGWPDSMTVVGLAFLRVSQNFVSIVDLVLVEWIAQCVERRWCPPGETSPLLGPFPRGEPDQGGF